MTDQEKYADKIAKLLRKAENPAATPEEAEAFLAKAQQLMAQYAITETMLAAARGENTREAEEVIEEQIKFTGVYHMALFDIGSAIAKANDCRILIGQRGNHTVMHVIGHRSDVERVKMLNTSAQIQAVGAQVKWAKTADLQFLTASQKYKMRREFLFGFARGLGEKLEAAKQQGRKDATADVAGQTGQTTAQVSDSMELVLRGKKERVDDWVDEHYGKTLRSVSRRYASGGHAARGAGQAAGRKADLGGGKVRGGNAGQLGR